MSIYAKDIESEVPEGEEILCIVIGDADWIAEANKGRIPADMMYVELPWREARIMLHYEYSSGYGGVECHPFWAWTKSRVLFLGCYDGSTWIASVPRNPEPGSGDGVWDRKPAAIGGG